LDAWSREILGLFILMRPRAGWVVQQKRSNNRWTRHDAEKLRRTTGFRSRLGVMLCTQNSSGSTREIQVG
jgi:hypothetical protein